MFEPKQAAGEEPCQRPKNLASEAIHRTYVCIYLPLSCNQIHSHEAPRVHLRRRSEGFDGTNSVHSEEPFPTIVVWPYTSPSRNLGTIRKGCVMARKNCWEAIRCGRELGGSNCAVLGVCPAATETRLNGINHGRNGGRACWTVSGTRIDWGQTASGAPTALGCLHCTFLHRVEKEEGAQFSFLAETATRSGFIGQNTAATRNALQASPRAPARGPRHPCTPSGRS